MRMVKVLEEAVAQTSRLPDADQEFIGQQLLTHVEKLRHLRQEIGKGIRSLDAGAGVEVDIDAMITRKKNGVD
jgi:hypothetical protein